MSLKIKEKLNVDLTRTIEDVKENESKASKAFMTS